MTTIINYTQPKIQFPLQMIIKVLQSFLLDICGNFPKANLELFPLQNESKKEVNILKLFLSMKPRAIYSDKQTLPLKENSDFNTFIGIVLVTLLCVKDSIGKKETHSKVLFISLIMLQKL